MSIYAIIVTIVYVLGAMGLGVATLALLLSGLKERNYREFARRLMAIAVGTIASGVVLIPIYKLLADLAEGAEPLSPRALIIGGVMPLLLGSAVGFLANKLLRERSARAIRLLILLNAAFGTYMLIGLAGLYTIIQSHKTTEKELQPQIYELQTSASNLESSLDQLRQTAYQASNSLQEAEKLSKGISSALQTLRTRLGQPSQAGQFTSMPYYWISNLSEISGEMARSSAALREAIQANGLTTSCQKESASCLESLLDGTSKATEQVARLRLAIDRTSTNIAIDQEQHIQEAVLAILPNLVFIMGAFLIITISKE